MLDGISDRFGPSFAAGDLLTMFTMEPFRTFTGPRIDFDAVIASPFAPPAAEEMCERWAVVTTDSEPTEAVNQLAELSGWCVVVVGDQNGPTEYDVSGVKYLTRSDQEALPYRLTKMLSWNHFGRKNVGFVYAIHHGAKVIYDVHHDHPLVRPEEGVSHASMAAPSLEPRCRFSSDPSSIVHNPYGCFGARGVPRPRGYPLSEVHRLSTCELEIRDGDAGSRIGVVQALASHDPDVDAIHGLSHPPGGLLLDHTVVPQGASGCQLRAVPAEAMTPYDAKATLHFPVAFWGMLLPVTVDERVSDVWRSYITQALLPAAGAVATFAPAWVEQITLSDPHNLPEDFEAERPLYERSGALVEFLLEYRQEVDTQGVDGLTPSQVEDLAITMFEYGIVEEEDVTLAQAWLQDLRGAGYDFQAHTARSESHAWEASRHHASPLRSMLVAEPASGTRAHVMLVIAVISARPERRDAIRNSWLAWGDARVEVRFFTEKPSPRSADEAALEEESAAHGDLVLMDIEPGMNFALKLLWAMRWMDTYFEFEFFLRLDDDYFLCLRRLLDELAATLEVGLHPLNIYAGHMYCKKGRGQARIDEAFLLLSAELVHRALVTPDLKCSAHAGVTAGWWFTRGNQLNQLDDVRWVHDPRMDHDGRFLQQPSESSREICVEHVGVHHVFPEVMPHIWNAAKDSPGPELDNPDQREGALVLHFLETATCKAVRVGISDKIFKHDNGQSCDTFVAKGGHQIHCGAAGC